MPSQIVSGVPYSSSYTLAISHASSNGDGRGRGFLATFRRLTLHTLSYATMMC